MHKYLTTNSTPELKIFFTTIIQLQKIRINDMNKDKMSPSQIQKQFVVFSTVL